MAYIDKIIKEYYKLTNENDVLNSFNIYHYLAIANNCKTNFMSKYFIRYLYLNLKDNYEDINGYSKRLINNK